MFVFSGAFACTHLLLSLLCPANAAQYVSCLWASSPWMPKFGQYLAGFGLERQDMAVSLVHFIYSARISEIIAKLSEKYYFYLVPQKP